jgi:hypothetical protein
MENMNTMKKIALISDAFFYGLLLFVFTLCFFRFLRLSLFLSLLLALVCGLLTCFASVALLLHKQKIVFLKRSEEGEKMKFLQHLCLLSDEQKTEYLSQVLAKATQTSLVKAGKLRLYSPQTFYFLHLRFSPLTADEVASAARWKTNKERVFIYHLAEENALTLGKNLGFHFMEETELYQTAKSANALPKEYLGEILSQNKAKEKTLKKYFKKRNAKGFFTSGTLLALASLFTPFPVYYLVFSGVLLTLAALSKILGYA